MAYIGKEPIVGNFQVCDAISVVNGQAAYTMQVSSVNVSPETANHMLVSLNGVLQAPTSSYTVSGSTITFASNLVTGDVIDFIQILGNVLDLGVPSDSTVSTAKIVDANVTQGKIADQAINEAKMQISNAPTNGYMLTAQSGNTGGLTWAEAGGGSWNLISTTTISSDATTLVTGMDSTYDVYCFQLHDIVPAGTQEMTVRYQIGGAIKTDGYYDYVACRANAAPSDNLNTGGTGNDTAEIQLLYDSRTYGGTHYSLCSTIYFFNPSGTALRKLLRHSTVYYNNGGGIEQVDGCGSYNNSNAAVTGLQFYSSNGQDWNSGKIKLYGIT